MKSQGNGQMLTLKIVFAGKAGVGKTSLLRR
jgi:GTPase SAR1 family protein